MFQRKNVVSADTEGFLISGTKQYFRIFYFQKYWGITGRSKTINAFIADQSVRYNA